MSDSRIHPNNIATRFKVGHKYLGDGSGFFKKGMIAEKSLSWKGDNIGYQGIHRWLRFTFGKASKCENPTCKYPRKSATKKILTHAKLFVWAKVEGKKYERRRENFFQLCSSCHQKYDNVGQRAWIKRNKLNKI